MTNKISKVYHLSHTDLDGYGCQYISREFFKNIVFFNANYGREVIFRINEILNQISNNKSSGDSPNAKFGTLADKLKGLNLQNDKEENADKILIIISDLGLNLSEATYLNTKINELNSDGKNIELVILDHHISGEECAQKFAWYKLDDTKCATKIVYTYLKEHYTLLPTSKYNNDNMLELIVEMINSVDIWQENGYKFEFGKVAMGMISGSNELNKNMFDIEHREYKFKLMDNFKDYLEKENGEVEFDNAIFCLKKIALGGDPTTQTMDHVVSHEQVRLLGGKKDQCEITVGKYKGFLSYAMGGISVLGNLFLHTHNEYDFYIDVNTRGNVSLRSNDKCNVSELSAKLFNGGGHKNASGGRIDAFKESFMYKDIKEQVENIIKLKYKG